MNTIDAALLRETLGHYPTGVAVVTAISDDAKPAGMVVGTFTSVSLDPPLVAFFPTRNSGSFAYVRRAQSFCINVLASDQEPICRQLAAGGADKFAGTPWHPAPMGAPILADAVSWVECTFEEIREAGDHFIVLGRVQHLGVQRSTLPLLFFQGGYGRFAPGSFIATPDPELIQATSMAESIRSRVEQLSARFGLDCSVLAQIRQDGVQVLIAGPESLPRSDPLGHRTPIVPPLGAAFFVEASDAEVNEWLARCPADRQGTVALCHALLQRLRQQGYSLLLSDPSVLQRHRAAVSAFDQTDRLPRHERAVQQATSELLDLYDPELEPGRSYDVESIVVPVSTPAGNPRIAVRLTGFAAPVSAERIQDMVHGLQEVAASASHVQQANAGTANGTRPVTL